MLFDDLHLYSNSTKYKEMGKIKYLNNSNHQETDILRRIEEENAQEDSDEKKRLNIRKKHLHYIFLLIVGLIISDALGWISIKTDLVSFAGIATKILSYFPKMNSS